MPIFPQIQERVFYRDSSVDSDWSLLLCCFFSFLGYLRNIAFCGEEWRWDVVILSFILPLYIDLGQLRVPESAVPIPVHSETRMYLLCYLFWSYHPAEAFIAG